MNAGRRERSQDRAPVRSRLALLSRSLVLSLSRSRSRSLVLAAACAGALACQPGSDDDSSAPAASEVPREGTREVAGNVAGDATTRPSAARTIDTALRFEDAAEAMGLAARHVASRSSEKFMPEILGGGLAIVDVDRDGDPDVVFVNSGTLDAASRPAAARNRLFLNDGAGSFTDATDAWQLPSPGYGMGVAAGDVDGDGWPDLLLTSFGSTDVLLRNTGERFEDITDASGLGALDSWRSGAWSTSASFVDHDLDGDLDLFVVRYVAYDTATALRCLEHRVHVYCSPLMYAAAADGLYRNEGDGTFVDATSALGPSHTDGKGLALGTGDLDGDGATELYVANDSTRNMLWRATGDGALEDVAELRGVAYSSLGQEEAGMGVDFADMDGDGRLDILCTNFQGESTSVYCQDAAGFFRDRSDELGIGTTSRHRLSFGIDAFDADNDGDEDLAVANGHIDDVVETHRTGITFAQPDTLYEQVEPGRFVDVTDTVGAAFATPGVTRGLTTSDLDGDGDLDVLLVDNDGRLRVARNATQPMGAWLSLWLEGHDSNRSAIGARVETRVGERTITRLVMGAHSYLTAPDTRVHLGLGHDLGDDARLDVVVHWPGGEQQMLGGLAPGRAYHVVQGRDAVAFRPGEAVRPPD